MATRKSRSQRSPAVPAARKLPAPAVRTVVIAEATRRPHRVRLLARAPHIDRPQPIRPRRELPRVPEGEERTFHSTTEAREIVLAMAADPGDEIKIVRDTELTGPGQNKTAANVDEPSAAMNGDVVFYTGNWYAAVSTDGGKTFRYLDPATAFQQFDPPGATYCCDQIVQYVAAIDTFVWLLQYSTANDVDNFQRLAFARTSDVAAGHWRLFDVTTKGLGVQGSFLDFPDLAVGAGALYMTTNIFPSGTAKVGSAVVRIPFKAITTGPLKVNQFVSFDHFSFRVAQNCGKTAYFAAHEDTSTLRVFSWPEKKAKPTSVTVAVSRWIGGNGYQSRTPDNRRWLDRADPRITGATLAGTELWFAWGVNAGSNQRPKPFVQIARIDSTGMTLVENVNIFDTQSATCYAALATNVENEVGISYFIGGGTRFPTHIVGVLTSPLRDAQVAAGQRGPLPRQDGQFHWGDYLTARPAYPNTKLFCATGYVMKGTGSGDGSNRDCTPHFVVFGRKRNTP